MGAIFASESGVRKGGAANCSNEYTDLDEQSEPLIDLLSQDNAPVGKELAGRPLPNSVLQFTCAVYYCREGDGVMVVDVVRFGDCIAAASCDYVTADATAKAGVHYTSTSGKLEFEPEETTKSISIDITDDDSWDANQEFSLLLTQVEGAHAGSYLYKCRVKIINDDCWPTNKYREQIQAKDFDAIPGGGLMIEFSKFLMRDPLLRKDTIKVLVLGQLKNVSFFLTTYLMLYMVDVVMVPEEKSRDLAESTEDEEGSEFSLVPELLIFPGDRKKTAMAVGLIYFAQYLLTHHVRKYEVHLSIPGGVRRSLQKNLVHIFLDCKEEVRASILGSDLIMTIVRDAVEVADIGYQKSLGIFRIFGKMVLAALFILAENRMVVFPLIVYPVVLSIWYHLREETTRLAIDRKAEAQNRMINKAGNIVSNVRMITDFLLKESQADVFDESINEYLRFESDAMAVEVTNISVGPWITVFFVSAYIALGATLVEGVGDGMLFGLQLGTVSLGAYLATVNVFKEIGAELHEVYAEAMEIQKCFCPLKAITQLMNSESDLPERMLANRKRRSEGMKRRLSCRTSVTTTQDSDEFAVDKVIIYVKDVVFKDSGHVILNDGRSSLMQGITQEFLQGQMYAFIGPPRQGKSTLLRLLGQADIPKQGEGEIFFPPHLRVLHVSRASTVLHDSFLMNVLLGRSLKQVGGIERIKQICRRVGYEEAMIESVLLRSDLTSPKLWTTVFSHSDYTRLSLVRVFLMNPEVLVLHHPVMAFGAHHRIEMLKLFKEHVSERGIALPSTRKSHRRPRTVFFSASFADEVDLADRIFHISSQSGMREVGKETLDTTLPGWSDPKSEARGVVDSENFSF